MKPSSLNERARPPTPFSFSRIVTVQPALRRRSAVDRPQRPAPITTQVGRSFKSSSGRAGSIGSIGFGVGGALRALALVVVEQPLAQPDRRRAYFDQFVVVDVLQRFLELEHAGRREADVLLRSGSAHVRELLLASDVGDDVAGLAVLA